jgi:hypothetical protein
MLLLPFNGVILLRSSDPVIGYICYEYVVVVVGIRLKVISTGC